MIEDEVMLPRSMSNSLIFGVIVDWCYVNIGPQAISRDSVDHEFNWYQSSQFGHDVWHFANKDDATWFKLTWCRSE